jgi:hypothetical protein
VRRASGNAKNKTLSCGERDGCASKFFTNSDGLPFAGAEAGLGASPAIGLAVAPATTLEQGWWGKEQEKSVKGLSAPAHAVFSAPSPQLYEQHMPASVRCFLRNTAYPESRSATCRSYPGWSRAKSKSLREQGEHGNCVWSLAAAQPRAKEETKVKSECVSQVLLPAGEPSRHMAPFCSSFGMSRSCMATPTFSAAGLWGGGRGVSRERPVIGIGWQKADAGYRPRRRVGDSGADGGLRQCERE